MLNGTINCTTYCLSVSGEPETGIFYGSKSGGQYFCGEEESVRGPAFRCRVGQRQREGALGAVSGSPRPSLGAMIW